MKRAFVVLTVVMLMLIAVSAFDFLPRHSAQNNTLPKKNCTGYVVVEAGKGINCNGDTIKLINRHGYFEVASNYKTNLERQEGLN